MREKRADGINGNNGKTEGGKAARLTLYSAAIASADMAMPGEVRKTAGSAVSQTENDTTIFSCSCTDETTPFKAGGERRRQG